MKTQKFFFLVVIFAILAVSLQVSPTQAQEGEASTFGVEINRFWYKKSFDDTLIKAEAANNRWLRINGLLWMDVQPSSEVEWVWENDYVESLELDLIKAHEAGMEVILTVRGTPGWAQRYPGYSCGPMKLANIPNFANFMQAVVERYSGDPYYVKYYELWNEPDEYRGWSAPSSDIRRQREQVLGCWGDPDVSYFDGGFYADMLKQVYLKVKTANEDAQVVLGGLLLPIDYDLSVRATYTGKVFNYKLQTKFFEGILRNEGGPYLDYVNFHGYARFLPQYPTGILMERNEHWWRSSGGQVEGKLSYLKGLMNTFGIGNTPILITEVALADINHAVTNIEVFEALKADYLVYVFVRNIAIGIDGSTWYHMERYGWEKSGLLDSDNQPLPAYKAFQVMTTTLGGAAYQRKLSVSEVPSGVIGYEFKKGEHFIWVLFSENGGLKTIQKSSIPFDIMHIYNLLREGVTQTDTTISFNRPIYIDGIPNTDPIFTSIPDDEVDQYELYHYDVITASVAPENFDVHTIAANITLPSWLTLVDHGDGTATLSRTPVDEDLVEKSHLIDLIVTDSHGATATQSFSIWVNNVNDPPRFTSAPVIDAEADSEYTYDIETTDQDWIHGEENLTIQAVSKPDWLEFTTMPYNHDGIWKARLSGEPDQEDLDAKPRIVLRVTDHAGLYAEQNFTIGLISVYLPLIMR